MSCGAIWTCQILLFNNEIYGLTKGQSSPTSRIGTRSPSTPLGSIDRPANPCGLRAGFGRRASSPAGSTSRKHLPDVLVAAHAHKGAAFIEIFQNCIVYNKDVFADFRRAQEGGEDRQLWLDNGEADAVSPTARKGIALDRDALSLKVVDVVDGDWQAAGVIVHDVNNRSVAHMLVEMPFGAFPMALGVHLRRSASPTFDRRGGRAERAKASEGKTAGPRQTGGQGPDLDRRRAKRRTRPMPAAPEWSEL